MKILGNIKLNLLFYYYYILIIFLRFNFVELNFVKILIKFKTKKLKLLKYILNKNSKNINFAIYFDELKRIEIFKENYLDYRIDFGKENYVLIKKNLEDLILQFPDEPKLYDRLARTNLSIGNKIDASKNYNSCLRLQRQKLNIVNNHGLIVFISMPRSGTGYVSQSLIDGLKINDLRAEYPFIDAWFPNKSIFPFENYLSSAYYTPMKNGFVSGHAPASDENLFFLNHLSEKIVVNFRDPRQSLISWVHFLKYLQYTGNYSALFNYKISNNYFEKSFEYQIDWQIENYFLKTNINWIKEWLEASKKDFFCSEILYLNYEMLVDNMNDYFNKILNFYNINGSSFIFPKKPQFNINTHLRKGETNEWKKILSKDQILKINKQIPDIWFKKYDWDKH